MDVNKNTKVATGMADDNKVICECRLDDFFITNVLGGQLLYLNNCTVSGHINRVGVIGRILVDALKIEMIDGCYVPIANQS